MARFGSEVLEEQSLKSERGLSVTLATIFWYEGYGEMNIDHHPDTLYLLDGGDTTGARVRGLRARLGGRSRGKV